MNLPIYINQFGNHILSRLLEDKKASSEDFPNTILSPLGLYLVLCMAYIGGQGNTAEEIAQVLDLSKTENAQFLEEIQRILSSSARTSESIQTILANSLWAKQGSNLLPEFEEICRKQFQAEVQTLDFGSAEALRTINHWVNEKTQGKVEKILEKIPSNAVLFLINALYFKGAWKKPFDPEDTCSEEFTCLDSETIEVPMMNQTGRYAYAQTETYQAISLPYAGESTSLILVLPTLDEENHILESILKFQENANQLDWGNLIESFHEREGRISIPRFNVSSNIHLKQTLQALGMKDAFLDQRADFGAMVENQNGLYVSDVLHKTCFEVNEEGSEAAAVSKVELVTKSVMHRFSFHLNRPFFCVLLDKKTKTALFMGWIVQPV